MDTKELLELKQDIVKSKEKKSQLEGRRDLLKEELEKKYSVKTIPDAKKKLETLGNKITKMSDSIKDKTEELQEQLNESDSNNQE